MSDLVICDVIKEYVFHDFKCPHWDQVLLDTKTTKLPPSHMYL